MNLTFAHPWVLALVPMLIGLLIWRARRSQGALVYSQVALVANLPMGKVLRARRWGGLFRLAVGLSLVIGASGPRWPDERTRVPTDGIAVAVVLDVSRSMAETDFVWDGQAERRVDGAKRMLRLFALGGKAPGDVVLAGRPSDLFALVTFATKPEILCPLTLDHEAFLKSVDAQDAKFAAGEGTTNPGDALALALVALRSAPVAKKIILFISDGESNVPEGLKPRQAGQLAGNLKIPVYALDVAPDEPDPKKAGDAEKARETLKTLATQTEGLYFRADDGASLLSACQTLDRMEKTAIQSFRYRRYHEGFIWFAGFGLFFWWLMETLEATRWRRLP